MNGPAGPAENTGWRLFVHEYRCMAALVNGVLSGESAVKFARQKRGLRE
jgi:hypothetical protein